jgi:hypothetical protein
VAVPHGELRAAGDIAEVNGMGSGDVVGGFFEPELEIGTGDEVCVDVTTDLGGEDAEVWEG